MVHDTLWIGFESSFCFACFGQNGDKVGELQTPPPIPVEIPAAPVLTPEQALKSFKVAHGFHVEWWPASR